MTDTYGLKLLPSPALVPLVPPCILSRFVHEDGVDFSVSYSSTHEITFDPITPLSPDAVLEVDFILDYILDGSAQQLTGAIGGKYINASGSPQSYGQSRFRNSLASGLSGYRSVDGIATTRKVLNQDFLNPDGKWEILPNIQNALNSGTGLTVRNISIAVSQFIPS